MSQRLCRPPRRCVRTMNERVNEYNLRQQSSSIPFPPLPARLFPFSFHPSTSQDLLHPRLDARSTLASRTILQSWRMLVSISSHPDFMQALRKYHTFPLSQKGNDSSSNSGFAFDSSSTDNFEIIIFDELRKGIYIHMI